MNSDNVFKYILVFFLFFMISSIFSGRRVRQKGDGKIEGKQSLNDTASGIDNFLENRVGMAIGGIVIFSIILILIFFVLLHPF